MTEEEKNALIAEGKIDENGNVLDPANDGGEPAKQPEGNVKKVELTQEQLDAIIEGRLERERKKQAEKLAAEKQEAERKRLAENEEFKTLAEQYKAELEKIKEDARKSEINSKRTTLLMKAGYNEEQIARYGKFVEGETDEEMEASVELLKKDVPPTPKYVDPNAGNGSRQTPAPKDKEEKGRSLFQRLKADGRVGK